MKQSIDAGGSKYGYGSGITKPVKVEFSPAGWKPGNYAKPKGAAGLPDWFKQIRAGSDFMPAKIKPVSYNYMAVLETPNRSRLYGTPAASTAVRTDVGTQYFRPSDDVATEIVKNKTIWQDIKNLGGKVLGHGLNILGGALDLISRPGYIMRNVYMENAKYNYMTPNSAGGTGITGWEFVKSLGVFSPFAVGKDLFTGRLDDRLYAGWQGFTGKAKTTTGDVVSTLAPGWAAEHPKATQWGGLAGDIVLDPINFLTMGVNPGSIARLGIAGGRVLKLDKAGVIEALDNTLFTSAGRSNAYAAVRSDTYARRYNQLLRAQNKALKRADKKGADIWRRKADAAGEALYRAKAAELADELKTFASTDLKGANLARLMIKQNLNPLTAMQTASRLSTGAAKGSAIVGATQTVKDIMDAYHVSLVDKFKQDEKWITAYDLFKGHDIEYKHGRSGKTYPVKLSEAENIDEWLSMIIKEAAPIAKITEQGIKAARSRKGRVVGTEARSKDFIHAFEQHIGEAIGDSLTGDLKWHFDNPSLRRVQTATKSELEDPSIPKISEEEFSKTGPDRLLELVDNHWKQKGQGPRGLKAKRVIVMDAEGNGRIVNVEAFVAHARRQQRANAAADMARAGAAVRTPTQRAADALSGVGDTLAARREELVQHFAMTRAKSSAHATAVDKFINTVMDFVSKKDLDRLNRILTDESIPLEERIAKIINDPSISDRVVDELVKDYFNISIVNGKVRVKANKNISNEDAIAKLPEVVQAVLMDRWQNRIVNIGSIDEVTGEYLPSALVKGSNIDMKEGKLYIKNKPVGSIDPNYQRDINGEIASALIDGWRTGLHVATKMHLMNTEEDAELVFATLMKASAEAVNLLSADVKAQVMQLMYNMTGLRLPENFVPTANKTMLTVYGDPVIRKSDELVPFEFHTTKGEAAKNQDAVWRQLFIEMQGWTGKLFRDHVIELRNNPNGGYDIDAYGRALYDIADAKLPATISDTAIADHQKLIDKIDVLREHVGTPENTLINNNEKVTNSYSMLDFILHHKEILKAQTTTLRQVDTGKTVKLETSVGPVEKPQVITRLNIGRLSALDSFGFVDDEVKKGLEALATLQNIANRKDATESVLLARKALAQLFLENGGREYMISMRNPNADYIKHVINSNLGSLGSHAALKEQALLGKATETRKGSGFGPAYAGQLMEALWDTESVNHNFQKALQNEIMGRVILTGESPASIAKQVAKSIDTQFANHSRLNKILHPTVGKGADEHIATIGAQKFAAKRIGANQQNRNPVEFEHNNPTNMVMDDKPEIKTPTGLTKMTTVKPLSLDRLVEFLGTHGIKLPVREARNVREAVVVEGDLKNGVLIRNQNGSVYYHAPGAEPYKLSGVHESLKTAFPIFNDALQNKGTAARRVGKDDIRHPEQFTPNATMQPARNVEVTGVEPGSRTNPVMEDIQGPVESGLKQGLFARRDAETSSTPTPEPVSRNAAADSIIDDGALLNEADVIVNGSMENPADFANTALGVDGYTEVEKAAIREWTAKSYAGMPPGKVAAELHVFTGSLSADLYQAQMGMIAHMSDLGIRHKTTIRFAGMPFMPVGNPMNANHALAGVTVFNEKRSRALQFWHSILAKSDPATQDNAAAKFRLKMTRQSNLLDESLNQIYSSIVNAVAMTRHGLVDRVNEVSMAVHDGDYVYGPMKPLSRKERMAKASEALFDPAKATQPNSLDEFVLADGSNPLDEIVSELAQASNRAFGGLTKNSSEWDQAFRSMNHFLPKKFKLSPSELDNALELSRGMKEEPFTREWYVAMGQQPRMASTNIGTKRMKEANVVELLMKNHDAALRITEGRALHDAIWQEYAFKMTPKAAEYYNKKLVPETVSTDGEQLRGNVVSLIDIKAGRSQHPIDDKYIPNKFLSTEAGQQYYINEDMLPDINLLTKYMDGVSEVNNIIDTAFIHKVLNYFKQSVTIYKIPTYPVRNTMSDIFMSAMDGLTNPRYYRDSARVMQNAHPDSKVIDSTDFRDVIDATYMRDELTRNMNDPDFVIVDPEVGAPPTTLFLKGMTSEYKLNDLQIRALYDEMGLGLNRVSSEVRESVAGARLSKGAQLGGKAHDAARTLNDWREDWGRMAHFLYALEREAPMGGDLLDIARRAGNRVMKHHFDYNDVSLFGRHRWGQFVPFYKWIRNIIPYTLASVVTRPYAIKADAAINQAVGMALREMPGGNDDDPRTDFVIPDYIERDTPVGIGWYADPNGNKFMQWMGVSLPLSETFAGMIQPMFGPLVDPSGGPITDRLANAAAGTMRVYGALNPIVSGIEQARTGRQTWANGPASVDNPTTWVKTMAAAIPGFSTLDSMSKTAKAIANTGGLEDTNKAAEVLAGLGVIKVRNNSEKAQIGEINRIEDMNRAQRDRLMGGIKAKIKQKYPNLTPDQVDELADMYLKGLRQQQATGVG